jgi:N-acetylmuramoyl-L-alanine amidase
MSVTIDNQGWIAEAIGIYYPNLTFGTFPAGQPKWIVLHGTASGPGSSAQAIANTWAVASANGTGNASTHILINKDGTSVQGLSLHVTAWGNCCLTDNPNNGAQYARFLPRGNQNYNTISIEHVKYDMQQNSDELTPAQRATSFAVVKAICEEYDIPKQVITVGDPSHGGIIRHRDIDALNRFYCPGPYPFADLQNFLNGGPEMFSNDLCIAVWNSYFLSIGKTPPPRDTGIFDDWRSQWMNGQYKGCCLSAEYSVPLPNGDPGVAQNYAGGTCVWNKKTNIAIWL